MTTRLDLRTSDAWSLGVVVVVAVDAADDAAVGHQRTAGDLYQCTQK